MELDEGKAVKVLQSVGRRRWASGGRERIP